MSLVYAAGIAAVIGCGLYLMLSREIVRIVLGVMLVSACVNLAIFLAGRLGPFPPPLIGADESVLAAGAANPLPQALVLTAIVIGFSLVAFVAALALQIFRSTGSLDSADFDPSEDADPAGESEPPW